MIAVRDEPRRVYDMGSLTTHVLDTARGIPGADIRIELYPLLISPWGYTTYRGS